MYVAASTSCFPDLSYFDALERMVDLQFTSFELALHEHGGHLKPSEVHADLPRAVDLCRSTRRLTLCALSVEIDAEGEEHLRQFSSCCKLAKAAKIVPMVVRASEVGTPFNAEIERLRELVAVASIEGVTVAVKTERGRITQDPDTTAMMCDHIKGLGVTLDPSHFIYGPYEGKPYDQLLKYVCHVHLRDTSQDALQVRVGQGEVEYGRLVSQLQKEKYDRALSVELQPLEGVDHNGEMRKLRLLLESLL